MADTAAHLVDRVFPRVPVRQWVLSLPWEVRYILARDAKLLTGALRIFTGEVFRHLRRQAGVRRASDAFPGGVTGVQRFGGALNLNIHFHSLLLDGIYLREGSGGDLRFHRTPAPSKEELERVLSRVRTRIHKFLAARGWHAPDPAEGFSPGVEAEDPTLQDLFQAASIREWIGLSEEARRVQVVGGGSRGTVPVQDAPFSARQGGFSLHAGVRVAGGNREGLERLCRYVLRPPFAVDRLEQLPDGNVVYRFRRPRMDGSSHLVLAPVEFLEKLAALVPPPRAHLVRYHGVLAPNSRFRKNVIPRGSGEEECPGGCEGEVGGEKATGGGRPFPGDEPCFGTGNSGSEGERKRPRRLDWATLLKRSLDLDVLVCPRCSGRMRLIAAIEDAEVAAKILLAMGLPHEEPRLEPARSPPQEAFEFSQL